jgi:peptidoglycan L-alanyl-D-glutamate endopeptidase CwlK
MRDKVSISRVRSLHPRIAPEVESLINEVESGWPENVAVRITQGGRSFEEQNMLYAKGRTTAGPKVTNAKAGEGFHNYFLAIDGVILVDGVLEWNSPFWNDVVKKFVAAGYRWGADWDQDGVTKAQGDKDEHLVDTPHFEKSFGHSWRDLLAKYHNEDFIPHTKYVNI